MDDKDVLISDLQDITEILFDNGYGGWGNAIRKAINIIRKALNGLKADEAVEKVLDMFVRTRNNHDFVQIIKKTRFL